MGHNIFIYSYRLQQYAVQLEYYYIATVVTKMEHAYVYVILDKDSTRNDPHRLFCEKLGNDCVLEEEGGARSDFNRCLEKN